MPEASGASRPAAVGRSTTQLAAGLEASPILEPGEMSDGCRDMALGRWILHDDRRGSMPIRACPSDIGGGWTRNRPGAEGCLTPFRVRKPAHAVLNTAVWQGDAAPPSNPQLPARRDAAPEPVADALMAERHHLASAPPHDADPPCRRDGDMASAARRVGAELRRRGRSRATARGLPPERGPVGGRGDGAPRQPLPGTREAWPRGMLAWTP